MAEAFFDLIERQCGYRPHVQPNKRDQAFNIVVTKEAAQKLIGFLYKSPCISIDRKVASAIKAMNWKRPIHSKPKSERLWSDDEKKYALTHSLNDVVSYTKRTRIAVEGMVKKLKRAQAGE